MRSLTSIDLPESFAENVTLVCGSRGETWLRELPKLVSILEEKWTIKAGPSFANLSYNYVAPVVRADGTDAVLKLGLPVDDEEFDGETAYLRYLNGDGVVRLIDEEPDARALLLERASEGRDLRQSFFSDPSAGVNAAIGLLRRLVRKPPASTTGFVMLENWTAKLQEVDEWDFPKGYASKASNIFGSAAASEKYLLHGDFHHENILSSDTQGFLAIDPKGVIGDIKYDIAVFLNNHRAWLNAAPDLKEQLDSAVRGFANAFSIPEEEIRRWAFAQKVLGAFWTCTENGPRWRGQLTSADIWGI